MKRIFIINGKARAGKDTFINMCSYYTGVINYSSVQPVKDIAASIGWDGRKTDKDRKFLADLKKLLTEYNDLPFEKTKEKIKEFADPDNKSTILFVHIREASEIRKVLSLSGIDDIPVNTLYIDNPRVQLNTSNSSDANVEDWQYDVTITNDGSLDDLDNKARQFVKEMCFPGLIFTVFSESGERLRDTEDLRDAIDSVNEFGGYILNEKFRMVYYVSGLEA